jgi:outer membrane protein, heavy metal efflux system
VFGYALDYFNTDTRRVSMVVIMLIRRLTLSILIFCFLISCSALKPETIPHSKDYYREKSGKNIKSKNLPKRNSSLGDLIEFAVQKNPVLRTQYNLYMAARSKANSVGVLPNPQVSYSYYLRSVETRVGPQRHKITVSQKIPWLSKLKLKRKLAVKQMDIKSARLESLKSFLLYDLKKSWFTLWAVGKEIGVLKSLAQTLKTISSITDANYEVSGKSIRKSLQIKLEGALIQSKIKNLYSKKRIVESEINNLLGSNGLKFDFPMLLQQPQSIVNKMNLRLAMLKNSPLLNEANRKILAREVAVQSTRNLGYPDFVLKVGYIETGESNMPDVVDNGKDPLIVTLGISIPLWRSSEKAKIKEREALLDYSISRKEIIKFKLISRFNKAYEKYRNALRQVDDYVVKFIPLSKLVFKSSLASYISKKHSLLISLQAALTIFKLELKLIKINYQKAVAIAELEKLTGISLTLPLSGNLIDKTKKENVKTGGGK